VTGVRVAPEDPVGLVESLAHPDVRLVTLTVTEKGYRLSLIRDGPGRATSPG